MITKDDLAFIAYAIAVANKHSLPNDYALLVVDGAFFDVEPVPGPVSLSLPVIDTLAPDATPTL